MPRKPNVVPITARPRPPRGGMPEHNQSSSSILMVVGSRRVLFEFTSRFRELPPLPNQPAAVIEMEDGDKK